MIDAVLEDAFTDGLALLLYTSRIGRFVEGYVLALHWPVAPDAFLVEASERATDVPQRFDFYWIQRSDPSLIVMLA